MDINRDIQCHFSRLTKYTYGNITFYDKQDYESFIKNINYEKKYSFVSSDISSKK